MKVITIFDKNRETMSKEMKEIVAEILKQIFLNDGNIPEEVTIKENGNINLEKLNIALQGSNVIATKIETFPSYDYMYTHSNIFLEEIQENA